MKRLTQPLVGFFATALLVLGVLAPARAAAPQEPVLLTPTAAAQGVGTSSALSARFTDLDGDQLDTSFYLRKTTADPASAPDFTIVALPDTQNYSSAMANMPHFYAQTDWIANTKNQLNTVLVSHLGDVAGLPDVEYQYQRATQALSTLDAAHIPWTVIPGNHDMVVSTGVATLFDKYFPISKFTSWTEPGVVFGGYYGQNQFGADQHNRQAKNSYVRIDRSSLKLLVLNLEFNAPDDVLAWADRVIDAHPDRQVLLVTHNMIHVNGDFSTSVNRPGGNDPRAIFEKLVVPNCQIFMVINGHNSSGTEGEANSTKKNSCGEDVALALTNFQGRPQGGQGWLRYYTFQPSQNRILARTYSPSLGTYETDANSQFQIPFQVPSLGGYTRVHDATVQSGTTVTTAPLDLEADTDYEWYATATDGSGTTKSQVWKFRTGANEESEPEPEPEPVSAVIAKDQFERSVSGAWGQADEGGAWVVSGHPNQDIAVGSGRGQVTVAAGNSRDFNLIGATATTSDASMTFSLSSAPATAGDTHLEMIGRQVSSASYRAKMVAGTNGKLRVDVQRIAGSTATLASQTVPNLDVHPNTDYEVRFQTEGTSPTTYRVKVWPADAAEPETWLLEGTDTIAALQQTGSFGLRVYQSSRFSGASQTVSVDNLLVRDHTQTQPEPQPEPEPEPEPQPEPEPEPEPQPELLINDAFNRTIANGWGTADLGGPWQLRNSGQAFTVNGSVGQVTVTKGQTRDALLNSVRTAKSDVTAKLTVGNVAAGSGTYIDVWARSNSFSNGYRARLIISSNQTVRLDLDEVTNGSAKNRAREVISGLTHQAGATYNVRVQAVGTSPTQLRAKIWPTSEQEPTSWTLTSQDSTSAHQGAGGVGFSWYVSSGAANGNYSFALDDVVVREVQ